MATIVVPIEKFYFGNEHWRSAWAIDEIEIYCDLLENLQERIDSLETRGKSEEVALANVQAVISSYAFEIAMKSLWALDNPDECVPHEHKLTVIFRGLKKETIRSLKRLRLTQEMLDSFPAPFVTNRYSMEKRNRDFTIYKAWFLRSIIPLIREKIEETSKALLHPPQPPTA